MPLIERNGGKLFFAEARGAGVPVVLVHGWCCDHAYLSPQFEHFANNGRRVVAVDLSGHGRSDKPRKRYTMPGFADDVAFVCDHLGLSKAVVIGHSMGGIVAFDLASRYPELVSALVMLDAAIILPEAALAAVPKFVTDLSGPDYQTVMRQLVTKSFFLATDDQERKERILAGMASAPQHVAVSAYQALGDYDAAKAARVTAPSLYIAADESSPRADMARVREILPALAFGQTVGSGHFCQLEAPDQVNAMVDRFLAIATRPVEP